MVQTIANAPGLACTRHYYYDDQRVVEIRREVEYQSSTYLPIEKQLVWGRMYIDELVQIAMNQDPQNHYSKHASGDYENRCERIFWALHDMQFNVLGLVMDHYSNPATGRLVERYEYTPYGTRQVYSHGWDLIDCTGDGYVNSADLAWLSNDWKQADVEASPADYTGDGYVDEADQAWLVNFYGEAVLPTDDPRVTTPRGSSFRNRQDIGDLETTPLCEVGHQGLFHDEHLGRSHIHNRARYRSGSRFHQRDPLGYVDGMGLYPTYHLISGGKDPLGNSRMADGYAPRLKFADLPVANWGYGPVAGRRRSLIDPGLIVSNTYEGNLLWEVHDDELHISAEATTNSEGWISTTSVSAVAYAVAKIKCVCDEYDQVVAVIEPAPKLADFQTDRYRSDQGLYQDFRFDPEASDPFTYDRRFKCDPVDGCQRVQGPPDPYVLNDIQALAAVGMTTETYGKSALIVASMTYATGGQITVRPTWIEGRRIPMPGPTIPGLEFEFTSDLDDSDTIRAGWRCEKE